MIGKNYEIMLPAIRSSLLRVYDFLAAVRTAFALDEKTHFDIELATEEAITNIIAYAYEEYEKPGDFVLSITHEGEHIRITLQDWGNPFDPALIPPFDYNAPVEKRINGGMGMHFMRSLMDEVTYRQRENDNGTTLTMLKKIDQKPVDYHIEEELRVFEEVGRALSNERDVNTLLNLIVEKLIQVVDADRGTLYLLEPEKGELVSKVLQDETGRLTEIRLKIGEGVAGHVAMTGETVNIFSAAEDPHFAKRIDQSSGYKTETMLCTPMRNAQKEIIGVVQLLNKIDGVFTPRDAAILTVLSSQAAIAIENARLITSEKAKRQLADTLREVTSIINSSLDLDEVLYLILSQLERVIEFEGAAILLLEQTELTVKASRGYDIAGLRGLPLFKVTENPLFMEMIDTHKPIIIGDVGHDNRWVNIEETRASRSWMGVPLIIGNQVIGELGFTHTRLNFYNQEMATVAQAFANQAAAAIERARLHQQTIRQARFQQELETAYTIQSSLLPEREPQLPGWDIAATWEPAQEVAGDFFDFIALPDGRMGFVLADVCGKGVGAALFMALSRTVFNVMAQSDLPLDVLMTQVNNQIKNNNRANLFVTLFYAVIDPKTGEMAYSNAGHNPPIIVSASGEDKMLPNSGPALGIFPNIAYKTDTLTLAPGDMIVIYTDGITEAVGKDDEEFGEDRLIELLHVYGQNNARAVIYAIAQAVDLFTHNAPPSDDATLLVIKRTDAFV